MNAQPAITTLPCGCFFQGRDMVISPQCEEHTEYDPDATYSFSELSDRAKDKARDRFRKNYPDYDWWDTSYEEFGKIATMMGIEIGSKPVRLMNGKTRHEPAIYFSGFWCQGDGACFEGEWNPTKDPLAALSELMTHAPQDKVLHEIAFGLAHLSERCNQLIPNASVKVSHSSNYYHAYSVSYDVDLPTPHDLDVDNELHMMVFNALCDKHGLDNISFEDEVADLLRRFMDWMYFQLNEEYDYLTSDENIDQYLEELTFDEDGDEV